jgi:hypothetical protein
VLTKMSCPAQGRVRYEFVRVNILSFLGFEAILARVRREVGAADHDELPYTGQGAL